MTNLSIKQLEVAAVSISIASGCTPCVRHHVGAAGDLGATEEEIRAALETGSSVATRSNHGLQRRFLSLGLAERPLVVDEADLFGAIGAAVARNDAVLLKRFIRQARDAGIPDALVAEIAALAMQIKDKAASHVRAVVESLDAEPADLKRAAALCS